MLDKLGKADIGEASKAMGLVFVIGLILAVIGGTLATMVANDTTDYSESNTDGAIDATKMIGEFHTLGKGFVSLLAFWFPIIGVIMIAVGLGVLSLRGTVSLTILVAMSLVIPLVLLRDAIPLYIIVSLYGVALTLDVVSTISSKRFPEYEYNGVISTLHRRIGIKKTWLAYGIVYSGIFTLGFAFLEGYMILGVMASAHAAAAISNMQLRIKKAQCTTH